MEILLYNHKTKNNFFKKIVPCTLFIPNISFLFYLRTKKTYPYYKFDVRALNATEENNLPILFYLGKEFNSLDIEYKFLFENEILFLYEEDFNSLNEINVKIISNVIDI